MLNYVWPIALVILSNVFYQICAKSVPEGMHSKHGHHHTMAELEHEPGAAHAG